MEFGEKLKTLRKTHKITQEELASAIDVRRPAISGYEAKGKEPDFSRLCKIADYFGVSIDYLLGRTENPAPLKQPLTANHRELLQLYEYLTPWSQGRLLEWARMLYEDEQQALRIGRKKQNTQ